MRADQNIDHTLLQLLKDFFLLLFTAKPREHFHGKRKFLKAFFEAVIMLTGQQCRGYQHNGLFAFSCTFKDRARRHFRFAVTDITAQQTIHRYILLHIRLDFPNAPQLIFRFDIREAVFEFSLPDGILAEGVPFECLTLCGEFEHFLGHVYNGSLSLGLRRLPLSA